MPAPIPTRTSGIDARQGVVAINSDIRFFGFDLKQFFAAVPKPVR